MMSFFSLNWKMIKTCSICEQCWLTKWSKQSVIACCFCCGSCLQFIFSPFHFSDTPVVHMTFSLKALNRFCPVYVWPGVSDESSVFSQKVFRPPLVDFSLPESNRMWRMFSFHFLRHQMSVTNLSNLVNSFLIYKQQKSLNVICN